MDEKSDDMKDKAKSPMGNTDEAKEKIDKAADKANQATGGKAKDKIDKAKDKAKEGMDKHKK
jgi:hypothetical protein